MSGKPQLFGTDGVRGVAGQFPLDRETVWRLGRALGSVLGRKASTDKLRAVVGEDTRESSAWIARVFAHGLRSAGVGVTSAGVITTPGVAFLTRHHGLAAGVMISASHNPYQDNGIKVFSPAGTKLPGAVELEVEQTLERGNSGEGGVAEGGLEPEPELLEDYLGYLQSLVPNGAGLGRYRLVVDCAHGGAGRVAPELLKRLGIEARVLNAAPDGRNINAGCGALHPEGMAAETRTSRADLGVAFDGDADRAIFAAPDGRVLDGDHVLYAAAAFLNRRGRLKGGAVVGTLMTNLGLEIALARQGIGLKRTAVGDKYVLEEMLRSGMNLGGEPSGHIIFSDVSLSGDGLITLLQLLRVLDDTGETLEERVRGLEQFPQVIRNVCVRAKRPLEGVPQVAEAVAACREELRERGRVVVRYSGTEKLARVMVEGESAEAVERHAARIAQAIDSALGARGAQRKS